MEKIYYPEDILIEKLESGEFTLLDYVNHFSEEWSEEYQEFCKRNSFAIGDESARAFIEHKDRELEQGIANGDA